jgi:hypothetical protein
MRVDKFEHANEWHTWIGKEVVKHSGKPAFEMNDGSIVDCFQVKLN